MVLQIFPAVPSEWKDNSFNNFRTEGVFMTSVKKSNGRAEEIKIISEQGGQLRLKFSVKTFYLSDMKYAYHHKNGVILIDLKKEKCSVKNGFE
ncbi:MAG: glycoside hydrolase family 95-like protein [Ginsengibacter sp.]